MDILASPTPKNMFARVGMSHVTQRLGDPYISRMEDIDGIHINTASQPNANPHFGTLTTLMCVAAIAAELEDQFKKPVRITFDMLENAPDRKMRGVIRRQVKGQDVEFQMSLSDSRMEDGTTLAEHNMQTFRSLFDFFQKKTGVPTEVRSYQECQAEPLFRHSLLTIFDRQEVFGPVIAPTDEVMRLRYPCPVCKWVDKGSVHTRIVSKTRDEIVFEAFCPDHGFHHATLAVSSKDCFDTNTPLRAIAKVPGLIEAGKRDNLMPLIVSGRDWTGRWDRCVHIPGVTLLGYTVQELPAYIFCPTVMDMLGAKLSKSLYVGNLYDHIPKGFMDLNDFMAVYGEGGLEKLWCHIREWARDPAYMDRDGYTVLYFALLLAGRLEKAEIMG